LDSGALCYFGGVMHAERTLEAVSSLKPENSASQEDVRQADLVVIIECDLLEQAPMMALAVRQAWRNGARVFIVGSECPIDLAQQELFGSESVNSLSDLPMGEAAKPVIICGTRHKGLDAIRAAADNGAKLAFILDGPNAFGCGLLALEHSALSFSEVLASGKLKGLIALEADLPDDLPQDIRVLAAADWQPTALLERAEVVLPVTSWVEMDGTYINNEGRAQRFKQVMQPGLPIKGLTPELHPPRVHRHDAPGGELLPSWRVLVELLERLGDERVEEPLIGRWERLRGLDAEGAGELLNNLE
jgi:NADH-quinone oxidoreductase subunit G